MSDASLSHRCQLQPVAARALAAWAVPVVKCCSPHVLLLQNVSTLTPVHGLSTTVGDGDGVIGASPAAVIRTLNREQETAGMTTARGINPSTNAIELGNFPQAPLQVGLQSLSEPGACPPCRITRCSP